jgi:hypothetical protein
MQKFDWLKSDKIEKQLLFIFLFSLVILQVVFIFLNETTLGGTDNVTHFQTARYAFKYPELFLDHWGKPVYTALSAPFAIWGFKMAQFFNVVVAILTLFLVYRISKYLYASGAIFIVVLTAFAPIYFLLMTTCLTEILFSFVLVASVYLFIKNKFAFSAIVLSFIPFVRNEGLLLFIVFALAFILKRSHLSIILLLTGAIFYSIVGYFVLGDFFWIINKFPHSVSDDIYGSGELLHFVKNSNFIFGIPLIAIILLGLGYWIFQIIRKIQLRDDNFILFLLIAGSWLAYFAAHSFVWWRGISSLGLIRVIGGVIPLAALTGTKGIQLIFEKIKSRNIAVLILFLISVIQIFMFFKQNQLPSKAGPIEDLLAKSVNYIKSEFPESKIYYFNTEIPFMLRFDPYDQTKSNWGIGDKIQPSNSIDFGDIIIWDAHFGPNEGRVPLSALENDPFLERVKSFYPLEKVTVLGGYDYSIQVFEKTRSKNNRNPASVEIIRKFDMENITDTHIIDFKGEKAWSMDESDEYSPAIVVHKNELVQQEVMDFILTVKYYDLEEVNADEVLLVLSIANDEKHLRYEKADLLSSVPGWKTGKIEFRITEALPGTATVSSYIWNKDRKKILFKDLNIRIISN